MLKKIISIAISAIAVSCIVGCSNQSPVSVSESIDKTAAISDYSHTMWDITGYSSYLYGTCVQDMLPDQMNCYIYYYRPRTESWIRSTHWGFRVATTAFGKCYHANTGNDIWCFKILDLNGTNERDSSGFVATAPSGERMIDIAAGAVQVNVDRIWILCASKNIYWANVNSGIFQGWNYVAAPAGTGVNAIAADPAKGGRVIIATDKGADTLNIVNGNYTNWQFIPYSDKYNNVPIYLQDIAISAQSIFYAASNTYLYYQYIGRSPTVYVAGGVAYQGVSVAGSKMWYLQRDGLVVQKP